MRKKIYKAIAARLRSADIGIKFISLWNRNIDQLSQQVVFEMPAVFVEFEPIVWGQLQGGVRSADVRVRLHIVTSTLGTPEDGGPYQDDALEHLDLIESVSTAMQGLSGDGFNCFMLVESLTDHDHAQVSDNEECYITRATDTSAQKPRFCVTGVELVQKQD